MISPHPEEPDESLLPVEIFNQIAPSQIEAVEAAQQILGSEALHGNS